MVYKEGGGEPTYSVAIAGGREGIQAGRHTRELAYSMQGRQAGRQARRQIGRYV